MQGVRAFVFDAAQFRAAQLKTETTMKYAIKVLETELASLKSSIFSRQVENDPKFGGKVTIDNVFEPSDYTDGFIECCRERIAEIETALEVLKNS
jgi:hypothetical protein